MSDDELIRLLVYVVGGGLLYLIGMLQGVYFSHQHEIHEARKVRKVRKAMDSQTIAQA